MRAFIVALLWFLTSTAYSAADGGELRQRPSASDEGQLVRTLALVRERQHDRLDAWLAGVQTRYESGLSNDMEVWRACRGFGMVDERVLWSTFDEWVARRPDSYAARLARGCYLKGAGWRARGSGYVGKTPAHRIAAMRAYFDEARADLTAALALTAKPTAALAALISIAGGGGVEREALLARALEVDRAARSPRDEFMHILGDSAAQGVDEGVEDLSLVRISEDQSAVVKLVNSTLYDALKMGASDAHLECEADGLVIKYRVDGVLVTVGQARDAAIAEQVISRLVLLAVPMVQTAVWEPLSDEKQLFRNEVGRGATPRPWLPCAIRRVHIA